MTIEARFRLRRSDFSLDFEQVMPSDGVIALFGASGSGKTTVLRCIAGLEHAQGGFLRVGAELWQDASRGLFVPSHRRRVGYVFQEASLFPHLSVRGNLDYAWKRVPARERRKTKTEVLQLLGITRLLERSPAHLSGGERQRVAIARALLTRPSLLLMDEPMVALDRASKAEILPYLETLREELSIPVVYVSHAPDEVARLADYMVLLEEGRVRAAGPLMEMLTRLDLPLAHAEDATSVIHSRVAGHDARFHLTYLDFSGGRFSIPRQALPLGHRVRLRIHARDVSLTRLRQDQTSILNIFSARVLEIVEENPAQRMIRLETGGAFLLSRITAKSTHQLELRPGSEVFAQVKSVALA